MSKLMNTIQEIVKQTGLPQDIWPSARPQLTPKLEGRGYALSNVYSLTDFNFDDGSRNWIRIHENTIAALQRLPAAQVLGHATLVRTPTQLTAMVSVAEAATVSMDESYCQLLWVMVQLIERTIRSDGRGYQYFRWEREISREENIRRKLSRREHGEGLIEQLVEISEQQHRLQDELETIRRQNDEILRLVGAMSQGSNQQVSPIRVKAGDATTSGTIADKPSLKFYTTYSTQLGARKKHGQWFLCTNKSGVESQAFAFLIDWLEAQLGGTNLQKSQSSFRYINLGDETESLERSKVLTRQNRKETSGCWRKKILSGNVVEMPILEDVEGSLGLELGAHTPFKTPDMSDCLILTAAALWSLFDNSLERMPNCQCTFRAAGKDFIQCRSKQGRWFIWHTFSKEILCKGKNCDSNIRIALGAEEAGQRLYTTTPCALGWFAKGRHSPDSTIWKTLSATAEFKRKTFTNYTVKEFQALAQLSVPVAVTPQIGGTVTFFKEHYEIANSIDHESVLAMERATAAVVLIYDESRRIHLTCDGADVIEMCCIQFLRDMGCDTSNLPPFSHSNAMLRLHTWCSSNFVSVRGTCFTGDHLVRQATRKTSELIETTKRAFKENTKLLYWLLEDVLRGNSGQAIKAPRCQHASWHKLAFAAPPLILVVGELDDQFLTMSGTHLRWSASKSKSPPTSRKLFDLSKIFDQDSTPGGIAASQDIVKRWLVQGHSFIQAEMISTKDEIVYGEKPTDTEYTYEAYEHKNGKADSVDSVFANCTCTHEETQRCLHYIQ